MKPIIYIRTSTEEQTPELQIADIKSICKEEAEIFTEHKSAWAENVIRPEWEKILSLIKKKKVSDLYVWDLDRAYRNRKRLTEFFTLCKLYSCKIHSYRQKWLKSINDIPSPFNEIMQDLLVQILGWIAEEESVRTSERIRRAIRYGKDGKAYSYKGNLWGRKKVTSQAVRQILELHKQGKTVRQIAKEVVMYRKGSPRNVSKSLVHKVIHGHTRKKKEQNRLSVK